MKALYRASQAAVEVDLVVRSICTLRPGVVGLSERIRVRSILGRFLEHSRIYRFENGGQSEYYIGSADWRARNLRKRVEVVVPVDDPAARDVLRNILESQLRDPRAWILRPDGVFERLDEDGPGSQERFMETAGGTEALCRTSDPGFGVRFYVKKSTHRSLTHALLFGVLSAGVLVPSSLHAQSEMYQVEGEYGLWVSHEGDELTVAWLTEPARAGVLEVIVEGRSRSSPKDLARRGAQGVLSPPRSGSRVAPVRRSRQRIRRPAPH